MDFSPHKLRLGLVQMPVVPGNIRQNAEWILNCVEKSEGFDLLAFPELATTGYLIGDGWERPDFLRENEYWLKKIAEASQKTAILLGSVQVDWQKKGEDGRPRKYNAALLFQNGEPIMNQALGLSFFPKTLSPNYREFDESRHFYDLRKLALERGRSLEELSAPAEFKTSSGSILLGLSICEDGWWEDYQISPFKILQEKSAQCILNLSCSPFTKGKNRKRARVFGAQARELATPIAYVNAVSVQNIGKTIYAFDGQSCLYQKNGESCYTGPMFVPRIQPTVLNLQNKNWELADNNAESAIDAYGEIFNCLKFIAKEFMGQLGLSKVVIGLSGGIDSALSSALYSSILSPENLMLINMPSQYNSSTTIGLSQKLASNLECYYGEIPISDSVSLTSKQFKQTVFKGPSDLNLELSEFQMQNIQSRDRGSRLLSAAAASFGGVFSCNANKAEMTVGYSTLYGDLCGFLALIGDLWKEDVYALSHYLNQHYFKKEIIPEGILNLPPSAELSASQNVDMGQGDPLFYPYHDKLFFSWIQRWNRLSPADILEFYKLGTLEQELQIEKGLVKKLFPKASDFVSDLERWWSLYQGLGSAKRVQAPPVAAVSSRAYGFDHREPVGTAYYSEAYYQAKTNILKKT